MPFSSTERRQIYNRTSGYCHICGKKLSFINYGRHGRKGAWHVDHSVPRAKGGTDHGNNLRPACIDCNLDKSTSTTRTARAWHGRTRAPLSKTKRRQARTANTIGGATIGGIIGAPAGPLGVAIGAWIGGAIGRSLKPDD